MLIDPQNTEKYSKTNFKLFYTLNDASGQNVQMSSDLEKYIDMEYSLVQFGETILNRSVKKCNITDLGLGWS
jgi:hypothetical protein